MTQSQNMGPMEHAAQCFIARLRAPYSAGASAQFDPETCKDFADLIEMLAQCADERGAKLEAARRTNAGCLLFVVLFMAFVAIGFFAII